MDAKNTMTARSGAKIFIPRRDPRDAGCEGADKAGAEVEPDADSSAAEGEEVWCPLSPCAGD